MMIRKIWNKLVIYFRPFLNLKFALCFFLAWSITNGWCYLFIFFGSVYKITWMLTVGSSYLAFLWLPCTPEKIVTIPLAIIFQRVFFKKDKKTQIQLQIMYEEAKKDVRTLKYKCLDLKMKRQLRQSLRYFKKISNRRSDKC